MISEKDFAEREVKYASLQLDTINGDGIFEGYASLFGTIDLSRDQVLKGAFQKSLNNRPPLAVKLLYQHNPAEPIGIWDIIREDHKGLYVKGRLLTEISRARDVFALMKRGALDGLSIGFKTIRARKAGKGGIRQLLEVELYEISIVTFPMHPGARVGSVKANRKMSGLPTVRDFERWLMRDAGFTRRQAKTAIAEGFKSLAITQDAKSQPKRQESFANQLQALTRRLTETRG